jgi:hypothetical protein
MERRGQLVYEDRVARLPVAQEVEGGLLLERLGHDLAHEQGRRGQKVPLVKRTDILQETTLLIKIACRELEV